MRAYLQDWLDMFIPSPSSRWSLIDAGGDEVVAVLKFGGRAKLSGIETASDFRRPLHDPRREDCEGP